MSEWYVRGSMKVANIKDRITESRLRWAGHVWRRDQTELSRQMLEMKVSGRRRGRPKTVEGWCDTGHEEHWGAKRGGNGQSGVEESGASSLWRPEGMSRKRKKKKKKVSFPLKLLIVFLTDFFIILK